MILVALNCSGCSSISPFVDRARVADGIAFNSNLTKEYVKTSKFNLMTYHRYNSSKDPLRVYIEGDGRAWVTKRRLSPDPTPTQPVALKLAALDASSNVAYIARPGQYTATNSRICDSAYWSHKRFAPEVINSINQVIDKLKTDAGVKEIELIGYSGGGAVAAIISAKRDDVIKLVTVCGNLDTDYQANLHNVTPLTGSLNPVSFGSKLKNIKQVHYVGSKDTVVPRSVAEEYFKKIGANPDDCQIIEIPGNDHHRGWEKIQI